MRARARVAATSMRARARVAATVESDSERKSASDRRGESVYR